MSKKQINTSNAAQPDKPVIAVKVSAKPAPLHAPAKVKSQEATSSAGIGTGKRKARPASSATSQSLTQAPASKIETVISMLRTKSGVSIEHMTKATGWQAHSVRGAISGQLKKKLGLNVLSEKVDGTRLYRIAR